MSRLGSYPAKQYIFEQETVAQTRRWNEVVTMAVVNGRPYALVGHFLPPLTKAHWEPYSSIKESFRVRDLSTNGVANREPAWRWSVQPVEVTYDATQGAPARAPRAAGGVR